MPARDDSSTNIPRLLIRPGMGNKLRALQYRWILMLTAHLVGFRIAARVARLAGRFLSNNIPLLRTEVRETIAAALQATHTSDEIDAITRSARRRPKAGTSAPCPCDRAASRFPIARAKE